MIKTREYRSETNPDILCETYSTTGADLLQKETDIVYSSPVIDVLEGYNEDGNPFSRYTYEEVVPDPEEATAEDYEAALAELGVKEESL